MTARLLGIGTATPASAIGQADAALSASRLMGADERRTRAVGALYAQSGVENRHMGILTDGSLGFFDECADRDHGPGTADRIREYMRVAPKLALRSCAEALAVSNVHADRVTHLVVVSCTGFRSPGIEFEIIRQVGLRPDVQRTTVGFMGCHGAINGMRVAAAFAEADPSAVVLVCCVEVCSVHFQYRPANGAATANALFADGSAACVIAAAGPGVGLSGFGATLIEGSRDDMGWVIGDHGFEMSLAARVPAALREAVGPWVDRWLGTHRLNRASVQSWAVHPGGPRIVDAVRDALGLESGDIAASLDVLRRFGNMSSPTILFIIRDMLSRERRLPMVALAFGPGLAGEAMLIGD